MAFVGLSLQQGNKDTEHLIINNTDQNFVITVELIDRSNDPAFGTAMYEVPAGAAMIVSQVDAKTEFVEPTSYYRYKIMAGKTEVDLNKKSNWMIESLSETKRRYQLTIQ
jgi:hypothetical protein